MSSIKHLQASETGFASMVIALILIIILALITVGFAQLTRREQQQALSKQLASQAYYAAETGINDVVKELNISPASVVDKTACDSSTTPYLIPVISASAGVSYTCLLIQKEVPNLKYDSVAVNTGQVANFTTDIGLSSLNIQWTSDRNSFPASTAIGLLTQSLWDSHKYPGLLQLDVTELNSGVSRNSLLGDTFYTYLYPSSAAGGTSFAGSGPGLSSQGQLVDGNCTTAGASSTCNVTISGLDGTTGPFLIHLIDLYYPSQEVTLSGTDSGGHAVKFIGAQVMVDSTGRARDVLKRLQVRIPINGLDYPDFAVDAQNICSRMQTAPTSVSNPKGTNFFDTSTAGGSLINPVTDNGCNPVF